MRPIAHAQAAESLKNETLRYPLYSDPLTMSRGLFHPGARPVLGQNG